MLEKKNEVSDETTLLFSKPYRSIDSFLDEAACVPLPRRFVLTIILSIGIANASFSTALLLISYLLADDNFVSTFHSNKNSEGLTSAAVFAGMLPGGLIAGIMCDILGRRPLLLLALAGNLATSVGTALAYDPVTLVVLRFLSGFAAGATEPPLYTLVAELSPRRHRGLHVSIVASFWMVGNVIVATVGLVVFEFLGWSWRAYVWFCSLPSVLGLVLVAVFVPESPRYLALVGRKYDDAVKVANDMADCLDGDNKAGEALRVDEIIKQFPPKNSDTSSSSGAGVNKSIRETLANAKLIYSEDICMTTTLPLPVVWFGLCYGSYCILLWINTIYFAVGLDAVFLNLLLFALANLPGNLLTFFLVDRAGRIPTLIGSLILSGVSLLIFAWYARPHDHDINTPGVVSSSCAFQALITVAWNILDTTTAELFPTKVRSTGIGVCTASGRIGAMVAQFVNAALLDKPDAILLLAGASLFIVAVVPFKMRKGEMSLLSLTDDVSRVTNGTSAPPMSPKQERY